MKLFLLLTALFLGVPFIISLFWMKKVKNGTLTLSKNKWHYKLIHWMYDTNPQDLKNGCPYYWLLVLSIYILIPYSIIRFFIVKINNLFELYNDYKDKKDEAKKQKRAENIEKVKKEIFKTFYNKNSLIFEYLGKFILICVILSITYILFIHPFVIGNPIIVVLILGCIFSMVGIIFILNVFEKNINKFFDIVFNIIAYIFKIIWKIIIFLPKMLFKRIAYLFKKYIAPKYEEACPEIEWVD
jgi:hypothetical protein